VTDTEWNKALVRRLVDEVVNQGRVDMLDDVAGGDTARPKDMTARMNFRLRGQRGRRQRDTRPSTAGGCAASMI
jgi:hypothetical protein